MKNVVWRWMSVWIGLALAGTMAQATEFYVSPTGKATGNGSINAPWDFKTALAAPAAVKPGDTIWMRGGTYAMQQPAEFWSKLSGTSTAPIIVRRYPGERVVVDLKSMASSFFVYGKYTWFWGLEIMSTGIPRSTNEAGPWSILQSSVDVHGPGTKFINCYIHDLSSGLSLWADSIEGEAYGNIVYHVGWQGPDRGHGHAIYSQNAAGGKTRKLIAENFLGEAFDIGMQLYGSGAAFVQDYLIAGNVVWNNGLPTGQNVDQIVIAGAGTSKKNIELDSNYVYSSNQTGLNRLGWQWDGRNGDLSVHGNWFIGGYDALDVWNWDKVNFQNNFVCADSGMRQLFVGLLQAAGQVPSAYTWNQNRYCTGTMKYAKTAIDSAGNSSLLSGSDGTVASFKALTGFDTASTFAARPTTGSDVFVRPNKYEAGRANIVIFNWGKAASVQVDLSGSGLKDGDAWEIRDVQNFNGAAVTSGVYSAAYPKATVPMSGLAKTQIQSWSPSMVHTAPAFGTFILLGGAALDGGGTPAPVDTTDPTVNVTAPVTGQVVAGTVTVQASASDNTGVASVQFQLDGAALGAADTSAPYTVSWDTTDVANGSHLLTATASDAAGNQTTSASVTVSVTNTTTTPTTPSTPSTPSTPAGTVAASFAKLDVATQGNWKTIYGKEGALIANDSSVQPSYGVTSFHGASLWTWDSAPTSAAALVRQAGNRIAATWYLTSSFTIDANLTDGKAHQVALYVVDYDSKGRSQRIDVLNTATGATLDSRTVSAFTGGMYLVWNITGHVTFKVTRLTGPNGVVSGVFFGSGTSVPTGDTTAPVATITAPTANQTVSGTVTVNVTATDNTGVAGVQFKVDGTPSGAEDTAAPYSFSWATTGVANGTHVLSATARDAAGNSTTASLTVTVSNAVPVGTMPAPSGYWTMNTADLVSGMELDKSSSKLNLTATAVTSTAGRLGQALAFNGRNSLLAANTAAMMDLTSSMTVSAWIKTTNGTRQEAIVSKYDTSGTESGWLFKTTAAGVLAFRIGGRNSSAGSKEVVDTKKVNDGQWHHVAVVVNLGKTATFYVDGTQTTSQSLPSVSASSGAAFEIGSIVYPFYATYFTGSIDDVKLFRSQLTAAQLLQLASGL